MVKKEIPCIKKNGERIIWEVDGKPFFARAGELHNSSASSLNYMDKKVWPFLRNMHLNCVLVPVYWECIEPSENEFDFSLVDGLIAQAQREGVRLIFLWFGLWKNAISTYVPEWVKKDHERFWYAKRADGSYLGDRGRRIISPFCKEGIQTDAKAFRCLMEHICKTDIDRCVVAMQVENEIGILGAARDYSETAQKAFTDCVPQELLQKLDKNISDKTTFENYTLKNWETLFGKDAPEIFMAWYYAKAVEQIVSSGKSVYPLPMFVNAWLEQAPWKPGTYPSGGPQAKMHDIWKAAAPSIDFYAPDIYVDDFQAVCMEYHTVDNPLFIPETRPNADAAAFFLYAVGEHGVLCFSPFGIEDMESTKERMDAETLTMLHISEEALKTDISAKKRLSDAYRHVESMEKLLEVSRYGGKVHGFLENYSHNSSGIDYISLSCLKLRISYPVHSTPGGKRIYGAGGGLIIELDDYEFLMLAVNCEMTWEATEESGTSLELLRKEEGHFETGTWVRERILNGDEQYANRFGDEISCLLFRLNPYS